MSASHQVAGAVAESPGVDFLPLKGTDHVEFYVGNARQAAYFYRTAFGMSLVAYAGPETGQRDRASYVVQQGKIHFVLTTSLRAKARSPTTSSPRRRRPRDCALGRRRAPGLARDHPPRCRQRRRALRAAGRVRRGHPGQHSNLRRHNSQFCRARRITLDRSCPDSGIRPATQLLVLWAYCTSIIWLATWAGTIWTSG